MAKRRTNQEWRTLFEHYESSQLSQRYSVNVTD